MDSRTHDPNFSQANFGYLVHFTQEQGMDDHLGKTTCLTELKLKDDWTMRLEAARIIGQK